MKDKCRYWILIFITQISFGQNPSASLHFDKLTINDGLSHNTVLSILQDQDGYIWIGTQNGLNKYDGYSFEVYESNDIERDKEGFKGEHISALFEDRAGNFWVGTNKYGINFKAKSSDRFVNLQSDSVFASIKGFGISFFFDDFDSLNLKNWQDQRIWVNNEAQCYVPDGAFGTREVSGGTLKLKVVNIGEKKPCDNLDKHGKQHPETAYVAGRIASKNRKEFIKGRWTARLKLDINGKASMFPAWWILGAQNNEPPVQEPNESVCWPMTGSGEIDIFEHHGDHQKNQFTTGAIKSLGDCDKGDWWSFRIGVDTTLNEFHEYAVEWEGSDLVYRLDGKEVHRNVGLGDKYPEPMFAILNYAKITDSPMEGEWVMEVDWVKHEYQN